LGWVPSAVSQTGHISGHSWCSRTRKIVQKVGISRSSTAGNMRTAYEFFGIDWESDCTSLADKVQEWAKAVYDKCTNP
jgi:hypothetical protein